MYSIFYYIKIDP